MAAPVVQMMSTPRVLRMCLSVRYPQQQDRYRLMVQTHRTAIAHGLHDQFPIEPGEWKEHPLRLVGQTDIKLMFVLFVNSLDKDGIPNQRVLAYGSTCELNREIHLIDTRSSTQASLVLQCDSCPTDASSQAQTKGMHLHSSVAQSMIEDSEHMYSCLEHDSDSFLCWVNTIAGKVPIVSYLCSLGSILLHALEDGNTCREQGVKLLLSLYANAQRSVGRGSWDRCTPQQKARWVVEMVSALPRAMIYEPDTVRTGLQETAPADQWFHLLVFPEPNKAGFDCEDAAIVELEILFLLKHLDLSKHPHLKAVQDYLLPYSACFVFGNIHVNGKTSAHAYAALLCSDYIDKPSGGAKHQAIVIEGTARVGGFWTDAGDEAMRDSFDMHVRLSDALGSGQGYSRVIRDETSMADVADNNFYGMVHAIVPCDHRGSGNAKHLLVHYKDKNPISVQPQDIFMGKPSVQFMSILETTLEQSISMCRDLPRSRIPYCESTLKQISQYAKRSNVEIEDGVFHVDMHFDTYKLREAHVTQALQKAAGSKWRYSVECVRLTDQLCVARFWFNAPTQRQLQLAYQR